MVTINENNEIKFENQVKHYIDVRKTESFRNEECMFTESLSVALLDQRFE